MVLVPTTRLGPYEIVARSGRAAWARSIAPRTNLGRQVAIKMLPDTLPPIPKGARASSARQDLAALNHPNIAQIYGFEKATPYCRW